MVAERPLDVLHIGAATSKDDTSQQLVGILGRHLIPHILYDFVYTCLDNLYEAAAFHKTILVDGVVQGVVDVAVFCIGTAVAQLHRLGLTLFHLQGRDVFGDVVATQRDDSQVAEHILIIDRDCRRIGSQVDKQAASSLLCLAEHTVGKRQGCQIHLGNGNASLVEAVVQIVIERLTPQDVQEIALQAVGLDAYRVELILRVYLVFLGCSIQNFLFGIGHASVGIHQFVDHFGGNDGFSRQILHNDVTDTANRLSADTHVDLGYLTLKLVLQLSYDVR